jgi:voltage-gated potassium channel
MSAHPSPLVWIGLAGVSDDDNARAKEWQGRLHWVMVAVALLALPAYVLDTADLDPRLARVGHVIDAVIAVAFVAELAFMMSLSSHPWRYVTENWLNVIVVASSIASVLGAAIEWIAVTRVLRVATAGLILVRAITGFGYLFTRRGAPMLVGTGTMFLAAAGAMFYWLEPDVRSYWDGLWLAFITGATVGYGDFYPRTGGGRVVAVFVVLGGWALLSLFTANIVALFIGRDERKLREELHRDIRNLRAEIAQLVGREELRFRDDLRHDVGQLRGDISRLTREERRQTRVETGSELDELRREIASIREELARRRS